METLLSTKRTQCVLCDVIIDDKNDSNEHILPNAIGGKKTVKGFICKDCNNTSGHKWDMELAKQLHPLCVLLNIRRSRGNVPALRVQSSGAKKLTVSAEGHIRLPTRFSEQLHGDEVHIQIETDGMTALRKKLFEVAKKYPQIDAEQALGKAEARSEYIYEPMHIEISFGGNLAGRSIVKSAMALIHDAGICARECELACEYLLSDGEACFGYYNEQDLVTNRPGKTFFHCCYVQGNPKSGKVLAYSEYFGFQRIVMCLSNNYVGREFSHSYSVDPVTGQELKLDFDLKLTSRDIELAYAGKKVDYAVAKEAMGELVDFYQRTAFEREKMSVIEQAIEYAFENCGVEVGEEFSEEQLNRLIGLIFEKMEPFLLRLIQRNRRHLNLAQKV